MMLRRIVTTGVVLFALLFVPRASHAGLLEFIWELSGPQLVGSGAGCLYTFQFKKQECRIGGIFLLPESQKPSNPHGPFLVIGGSALFSTPKDSDTQEYDWFDANMVAFEPGVLAFSKVGSPTSWRLGHGAGASWGLLFGDNFRRFDKFAVSIIPIEASRGNWILALKFRIYPNGFTDDEFGFGPRVSFNRPAEFTWGGSISYLIR
jgi:hypothetical protein